MSNWCVDVASVLDNAQHGDSKDYDHEVQSVCPYCGVGCQLSFKIKDDKIKFVEGVNGPANENRLCVKGRLDLIMCIMNID